MLEAFFLKNHPDRVDAQWRQKTLMACEILAKPPLRYMRPEIIGDRTRVDLMWNGKTLGIRGPSREDGTYTFWAVQNPDTVSPAINEMMNAYIADPAPLPLAQVRFREGYGGGRGLWLDTSNEAIRDLLQEKEWIRRSVDRGWTIELGQKKKEAIIDGGDAVLIKARPQVWLQSFDKDNRDLEVKSLISLFSQPGPETNRALLACGFDLLDEAGLKKMRWAEWGAGYGNLTAAYASRLGTDASASELDPPAAELLGSNMEELYPESRNPLSRKVTIQTEQRVAEKGPNEFEKSAELWLIDPPRPGFGALLETLKTIPQPPRHVLAYHCHAKGLIQDCRILRESNYKLLNWSSVDAFPATPHHEVVSLWERIG